MHRSRGSSRLRQRRAKSTSRVVQIWKRRGGRPARPQNSAASGNKPRAIRGPGSEPASVSRRVTSPRIRADFGRIRGREPVGNTRRGDRATRRGTASAPPRTWERRQRNGVRTRPERQARRVRQSEREAERKSPADQSRPRKPDRSTEHRRDAARSRARAQVASGMPRSDAHNRSAASRPHGRIAKRPRRGEQPRRVPPALRPLVPRPETRYSRSRTGAGPRGARRGLRAEPAVRSPMPCRAPPAEWRDARAERRPLRSQRAPG